MKFRETHPSQAVSALGPWHPVDASGGIESFITVSGITYKLHMFTTIGNSSLIINDAGSDGIVEYLVVGGGGGGGMDMGGGGGGGGVRYGRHIVKSGETISVTVGAGGFGAAGGSERRSDGAGPNPGGHQFTVSATNGGNSVFGPYTATGGGYGGSSYFDYNPNLGVGASGGSGGGTSGYSNGGVKLGAQGTSGQGFRGGQGGGQYYSGGGGGAAGQGADSTGQPNGGSGRLNSILGVDLYWGGGGGGASYSLSTGGNGGIGGGGGGALGSTSGGGSALNPGQAGGGGNPNTWANTRGGNGGANTGGGGGAGSHYNATNSGGEGGSGIVVVRYPISAPLSPLEPVTSGLVLHLDANNVNSYSGSGTTWNDLSGVMGNVNIQNRTTDWTFATSPEGVKGVYNATNRSDNNSPGINVPVNNGFNKVSGTIDIWVRPLDSGPGHGFFVNSDGSTNTNASNWFWIGVWETSIIYFRQGNSSTCCNDLTISRWAETFYIPNKWHNLTFSWNVSSGSAKIYFNGLLYASTTGIPTNVPNSNPTTTGQLFNGHERGDNMQFKGYCSTYRIYNRQLSDAEILQNYNFSKQLHGH